jgi:hypothetical protein
MLQHQSVGTVLLGLPGPVQSTKDDARELGGGAGIEGPRKAVGSNFRSNGLSEQAALTIEGEQYADAYLARLQADAVQPGELAVLMSYLTGEMLHGACRVVEKALRGGHHA